MARRDVDAEPVVPGDAPSVEPPTIDDEGVPDRCLSLTIRADWGHFRRIDRTVTKQTYRLPPRTTVAGMLAAIVGSRRDSYYGVFAPGVSAVAIEPVGTIRTVTEPMLGLSTNPDEHFERRGGTGQKTMEVRYPDSSLNRQLHSYELLVDPAYRIDVAVEDEDFYRTLAARLDAGTAHYPVSMGLSEYLAWIDFHGEFGVEPPEGEGRAGDTAEIDSVLPAGTNPVVPRAGVRTHVERTPAFMEADDRGRRTTGFGEYTFAGGDERLEVRTDEVAPARVGDRTVVFG
jgi:CRISPR-associated protein Cas5h